MLTSLQDLRYGIRGLLRSPRFTVAAVITLALGLAANLTIFTFIDATLLRPLPFTDAQRIMALFETRQQTVTSTFEASYPDFLDWRSQTAAFESLAGYGRNASVLYGEGAPELLPSGMVTDNFFRTLGVKPVAGRDFRPGEDQASAEPVIMISDGFWQRHFSGRPDAIGAKLRLDDQTYTVIGVLPNGFQFAPAGEPQIWIPLRPQDALLTRRNLHWLNVIGRLKPGATQQSALTDMKVVTQRLERQYPDSNRNLRASVVPLTEVISGQVRPILLVLLASVGLLLLVACANVANLLLARSVARRREIAIRTAMGATRWRIARQMLTEGITLALISTALGMLAAQWITHTLVAAIPASMLRNMPALKTISISGNVLLFAVGLALATGVLFALAPALQLSGRNAMDTLKDGTRSSQSGSWRRFSSALVIGEVAVSMVLLFGAGLLVKSFYRLLQVDLGFDTQHLAVMAVSMPPARYKTDDQMNQFVKTLKERLQPLPGVQSAGTTSILPTNGGNTINLRIEGQPFTGQGVEANIRDVDPEYLKTLRGELKQGRWFDYGDDAKAPQRVVINETFARMYLPGLDPLSHQVVFTFSPTQKPRQIVGVIRDIKEGGLDTPAKPAIYTPALESPDQFFMLAVRTEQDPAAALPQIAAAVRQVDPDAVTFGQNTMEQQIQTSPAAFLHRFPAWLAGGFSLLALLLGSVGLYGVVAYSVSQRTQEIGVRMALGARRGDVLWLVLRQGTRLVVPGIVAGVAAGLAAGYLLRSLLFGVSAFDPAILIVVTVVLAAVTLLASFFPARQATRVDPMVALRYE